MKIKLKSSGEWHKSRTVRVKVRHHLEHENGRLLVSILILNIHRLEMKNLMLYYLH